MIDEYLKSLIPFSGQYISNALILASILSIVSLIIVKYAKYVEYKHKVDLIPGPKCSKLFGTFIGNLELFWTYIKQLDNFTLLQDKALEIITGVTRSYQDQGLGIFKFWLGPVHTLTVLFRADTVEKLLSSNVHIEKSREYNFFRPWLGLGLLTSSGDRWRSHRKLLTPSFHFKILENFIPVINGQQKVMIDILDRKLLENNGLINDVRPIITNCALDTICETAMGVTVNAQTDLNSQYVQSVRNVLIMFFQRFLMPWLWSDMLYKRFPSGKQFLKSTDILHKFTDSVIKERKTEIMKNMSATSNDNLDQLMVDMGSKRKLAFLDSLLVYHIQHPTEFTELDIREEVDTFMFEGHDTTSAAIQFSLLLIGLDMKVQTRIHDELDSIFSDDMTRDITMDDLRDMKYLEQCIKEALRLYPSVPYVARVNHTPLQVDDYEIPAGATCVVLFYMLHRDPKVFPNPEVFDPNRFDTESSANQRHPYAYAPFSAGPRNCIGQKFAMLEEKALLASILRRYEIQSLTHRDTVKLDMAVILKPSSEIKLKIKKRF